MHTQEGQKLRLENLPNELLGGIFALLARPCPSEVRFNEQPDRSLITSKHIDLKTVSYLSKRFRSLVLPLLFAHAHLDPYHLTGFLAFIKDNNLTNRIVSVVASLQGPCSH